MVRCEMCGSTTSSPKTVKVEGAELQVCSECADFGTEVRTEETTSETSTKYSTDSSGAGTSSGGASGGGGTSTGTSGGGGGGNRGSDMFDDLDEVAPDYDDRIRSSREEAGLSQAELADELNEKASLIRKLERGETLPSDDVQSELEGFLGITLSAGGGEAADEEWEGGSSTGEYTLGDVVKRKD